ncbi:MAG: T9SS type A sorting domain-containing protein [Candidatus Electryonea clarkiae]|nr:T9SS type A sorting domain-containing protein [Candidatus Electryonea clarkiae]MDP8286297.1 T9SS type A sorting domain-containing protein [Candidatus Electryonea clarkiae]
MKNQIVFLILTIAFLVSLPPAYSSSLILSTSDARTNIIDDILDDLDQEFDYSYDYQGHFADYVDNLDEYERVVYVQRSGYYDQDVFEAMAEFASDGGHVIYAGNSYASEEYAACMNEFVEGTIDSMVNNDSGFRLVDDEHALAFNLPDESNSHAFGDGYFYVNDDDAEVVAENMSGWPMFLVKPIDHGEFFFLAVDPYYAYYRNNEDLEILTQMFENMYSFFHAAILFGTVTDAGTGDALEDVEINLYDEDDELIETCFTQDDGSYLFEEHLVEDIIYYATYAYEGCLTITVEGLEGENSAFIEQNVEMYPLWQMNIQQVQEDANVDDWVEFAGIVTQPTNTTTIEHTSFYVGDTTQYGVHVYMDDAWDPENDLLRGDSVRIIGRRDEIDDVSIITDLHTWEVISHDNQLPELIILSTGDMMDFGDMEGSWMQTAGFLAEDPERDGSYVLDIDDGSGELGIMIYEDTGIDLTMWSEGDWLMFQGVVSITADEVVLIPSLEEDVSRTPMAAPTDLQGEIWFPVMEHFWIADLSWAHTGEGGEINELLNFIVYRDGEEIVRVAHPKYSDTLDAYDIWSADYYVTASYHEGETEPSNTLHLEIEVAVNKRDITLPEKMEISAVYPNPFNSTINIVVATPKQTELVIGLYDITGRLVERLASGNFAGGYHSIQWNAKGPSGVYFIRSASTGGWRDIRKVIYMK